MTVLTEAQLANVQALDPTDGSGDRVAAYMLLWQYTGSAEALLQANIASFSGGIGGAAFGANLALQESLGAAYPGRTAYPNVSGILDLSEQVFDQSINGVTNLFQSNPNFTMAQLDQAIFNGAALAWQNATLAAYFPGNIFSLIPTLDTAVEGVPGEGLFPGSFYAVDGSASAYLYAKTPNALYC